MTWLRLLSYGLVFGAGVLWGWMRWGVALGEMRRMMCEPRRPQLRLVRDDDEHGEAA
jgi:hypothetical protein